MSEQQADVGVEPERFWIKDLTLENFRRFEKAELGPFNPRFNLIIGENGAGKTSVLAALRYLCAASDIFADEKAIDDLTKQDVRRASAENYENISANRVYPAIIRAKYAFDYEGTMIGHIYHDGSCWNNPKYFDKSYTPIGSQRDLKLQFTYPLATSYGAQRPFVRTKKADNAFDTATISLRNDAFENWRYAGASSDDLLAWITWQSHVALYRKSKPPSEAVSLLSLVSAAIVQCVDGAKDISFNPEIRDIIVTFDDGRALEFSTMSDGQKTLIGMVADIARRAILLNPHLGTEAIVKTPGVILIDELDLHLHPRWQRTIIANLKKTFPLMQFFATTHSPILIGEARPEELVVLTETGSRKVEHSFGLTSNQALEFIMGAEERDSGVKRRIDELFNLLEDEKYDEARIQLKSLRAEVGDIPEVVGAEAYLWRVEHLDDEAAE